MEALAARRSLRFDRGGAGALDQQGGCAVRHDAQFFFRTCAALCEQAQCCLGHHDDERRVAAERLEDASLTWGRLQRWTGPAGRVHDEAEPRPVPRRGRGCTRHRVRRRCRTRARAAPRRRRGGRGYEPRARSRQKRQSLRRSSRQPTPRESTRSGALSGLSTTTYLRSINRTRSPLETHQKPDAHVGG